MHKIKNSQGFSLLEVLMVLAIIAVGAVGSLKVNEYLSDSSNFTKQEEQIRSIESALFDVVSISESITTAPDNILDCRDVAYDATTVGITGNITNVLSDQSYEIFPKNIYHGNSIVSPFGKAYSFSCEDDGLGFYKFFIRTAIESVDHCKSLATSLNPVFEIIRIDNDGSIVTIKDSTTTMSATLVQSNCQSDSKDMFFATRSE